MKILYEDRDVVVCVKPAGVLSQSDSTGKENMVELLGAHFREAGELSVAYPIHRLDKATTGVLVYAKSHTAAGILSAAVQGGKLEKYYLAVVRGMPAQPEATLIDHLRHDKRTNLTAVVKPEEKGAKRAVLDYRLLEHRDGACGETSLLLIRLHTGRTHQIRAQFAHLGLPLVGDDRYGEKDWEPLALCACRLTFPHPATGKPMTFAYLPRTLAGFPLDEGMLPSGK